MKYKISNTKFENVVKNKFGNERKLFIEMISRLYPNENPEEYYRKNKGNFSAAKNNNRSFKAEEIICLEEILRVPFVSLIEGYTNDKLEFIPDGIKYVAYIDKIEEYERLFRQNTEGISILFKYDEFDKNIIDYIMEYDSINGLCFLIREGLIQLDLMTQQIVFNQGLLIRSDFKLELSKKIIRLLVDNTKCEEFNILFPTEALIRKLTRYTFDVFNKDDIIKILLSNIGFLNGLFEKIEKIDLNKINLGLLSKEKSYFINPLLTVLLNYSLKYYSEYEEVAKYLLDKAIFLNQKVIKYFKMDKRDKLTHVKLESNGLLKDGITTIVSIANYKIEEEIDFPKEMKELLYKLDQQLDEVILTYKKEQDINLYRVENGKIKRKHFGNKVEYEFLSYMSNLNYNKVPQIIKINDNGIDIFSLISGVIEKSIYNISFKRVKNIILELKNINTLAKKILTNKVYVHGNLIPSSVIFNGDNVVGIVNWNNCFIGEEYYDFIDVFLTCCQVGDRFRKNEVLLKELMELIEIYDPDEGFKKDFASKIRMVIKDKLNKLNKSDESYEKEYEWFKFCEIWVDLKEDKIRELMEDGSDQE